MLKLFKNTKFYSVKNIIDSDESIIVNGDFNTIVMYTFFIKSKSRKVLVYQRPGDYYYENFRNLYSIGLGGRLEIEDIVRGEAGIIGKIETVLESGLREIEEEVTYHGDRFSKNDIVYVGLIEDTISAFVCAIEVDESLDISVNEPENIHVGWVDIDSLISKMNLLEPWSRDIVNGILRQYNDRVSMESSNDIFWKKIPGYSKYRASACGKIKNLSNGRISEGGNAGRYLKVSVTKDGSDEAHLEYLHILICKAFHGLGKDGEVVLHKNDLRHDCRASNLKWGTQSENIQDAYDKGLVKDKGANNDSSY